MNVTIISAGEEYPLSGDVLLTGIDGIGMAQTERILESGPLQHGKRDRGYRLQERRIALAVTLLSSDFGDWLGRRQQLMRALRSTDEPLRLRIVEGEIIRQIDCYLSGMMAMPVEAGAAPRWQSVGIELLAPDPTWYDPEGSAISFQLGGEQKFEVPLKVPVSVGASAIDQSIAVPYGGTWDAFPIITIMGPITSPVLTNLSLGDKLDFTGITIANGDRYTIDCRYGHKTVFRASDGANRIMDLSDDSNLATFRLGAHPEVVDGDNSIRISGSGLTAASKVILQYNTRYVGV